MRILGLVAFVGVLAIGQSAWATGFLPCSKGCDVIGGATPNPEADYAVPDDGVFYNWTFQSDSAHPNVIITVPAPNTVFGENLIANGDGTFKTLPGPDPGFFWREFQRPGSTLVQLSGQPSFNNCAGAAAGVLCGYLSDIWNDGAPILVNTTDFVEVFATSSPPIPGPTPAPIPEPQTWLMMLAGLSGMGAALRASRRSAKLAAAAA